MSQKIMLTIEGMTCGHCVMTVQKALEGTQGVEKAHVDLNKKNAEVIAQDSVETASLIQAVENTGYSARPA